MQQGMKWELVDLSDCLREKALEKLKMTSKFDPQSLGDSREPRTEMGLEYSGAKI